jgi:2-polyprenyl-6-methoxyphenol hydroxylase-like FAD-dependent oxidoreductase
MCSSALVVGAGIGGLAAARVLRDVGFEVRVLERSPSLEPLGAGISLWPNAVRALREIGVGDLPSQAPIDADSGLRRWDGRLLARADPASIEHRYGEPLLLLQRSTFHRALLADGIADLVETGVEVTRAAETGRGARAELRQGDPVNADLLIGADGIRSAVRAGLLGDGAPRQSGLLAYRAIVDMPEASIGVSEYWGAGRVFGLVPVDGNRLYWFATRRGDADEPREQDPIGSLLERHRDWAPEIAKAIEATPAAAVLRHSLLDRKPTKRWCGERTALLGDAAHPMLPFIGQGGCQALEDAAALGKSLRAATDIPRALRDYEERRRRQAARAVTMSHRMGRLIHLRSAPLRALRNQAIASTPESLRMRQLDPIVGSA